MVEKEFKIIKKFFLLKNKERDKKANAYMDHLLREHKKEMLKNYYNTA